MSSLYRFGESTGTDSRFSALLPESSAKKTSRGADTSKRIADAVYGHIRAVRALGRESINTNEIARALSLSPDDVARAVTALKNKGVKVK